MIPAARRAPVLPKEIICSPASRCLACLSTHRRFSPRVKKFLFSEECCVSLPRPFSRDYPLRASRIF
ncbi:hypothetical protein BOX24_06190 [Leptospirillum ferriphilum]|uniref:Uncharacterized protein n=1 Tax=Leptospirillum ferriphilum TaxID=178606 RepID=A0A1V3SXC8_9BACT|nr:hypothetical protein BOX24_06190 [Leptospirillum ferriphilum]